MNNIINENLIILDLELENRKEIIKKLATLIKDNGNLSSYDEYVQSVLNREKQTSTGVGRGISIPHGKSKGVKEPAVAFARLKRKIDWESFDDEGVKLVFLLAVPEESESNQHLKILSTLSRNLLNDEFKENLLVAKDKEEVNSIIQNIFSKNNNS